jgi:beta-glucosidase
LNGVHACENPWLYERLKDDWGFSGFVVTDYYFAQRTTVSAALAGLDNSQPGGSWVDYYGLPDFFGDLLVKAVDNGSVPFSRVEDMVARLWRPMFENGVIDRSVQGDENSVARTSAHLNLAQRLVEEGAVLLKNYNVTLPLAGNKYESIAVFGADATNQSQVSELHGGFVIDTTMVVQSSVEYIRARGQQENISTTYAEAYPGTSVFPTVPSEMFGTAGLNVSYWTTRDFSGPINRTIQVENITGSSYPSDLGAVWPEVFSARYEGVFYPNTTGLYHFSIYGNGGAILYLNDEVVANLNGSNFGMVVQGITNLSADTPVNIRLDYSMATSVDPGIYGVSLGVNVADPNRYPDAVAAAQAADVSIIFVNDEHTEGLDSNLYLELPGDQNGLISMIAAHSKKTIVVLNTNSAILMPWLGEVDAVIEVFYPGQQVGSAMAALLYGDVNFSGKLPITFPKRYADVATAPEERFPGMDLKATYSEGLLVGYRWFDEKEIEPLFPFGHGLSYTEFDFSDLKLNVAHSKKGDYSLNVNFKVQNVGGVAGKEIAQLYVTFPQRANEPPKVLKGFQKTESLSPNADVELSFSLNKEKLQIWDEESRDWKFISGLYTLSIGKSSRDILLTETIFLA